MSRLTRSRVPTQVYVEVAQTTPAQNTWYTTLDGKNICLLGVAMLIATTGETLESKVTIDGTTYTAIAGVAVNAAEHTQITFIRNGTTLNHAASAANWDLNTEISRGNYLFGKAIKVEFRKTTAAGTGTLTCKILYHQY